MTFSIVGRSSDGSALGVAVASKFLAVGAAVPAADAGVGAIATQSLANLAYRPHGLAMLRKGLTARQTLDALTAADELSAHRQAGIVDAAGSAATYTGPSCQPWAGGVIGDGVAIQGNILCGPEVIAAMERAWSAGDGQTPLAGRLLAALLAGDEAGGDRRGRQSAAILVVTPGGGYGGGSDVLVDLRVDDNPAPVPELLRLLDLHELYFGRPDPDSLIPLDGELADEVARRLARLGHAAADTGPGLDAAPMEWAGVENFEERMVPGAMDPVVLEQLRAAAP